MAHPTPTCTPECFGCKATSIGFKYTYGRTQFHGPTIPELRRKAIAEAKAQGNEPRELTKAEREEFRQP